MILLHPSQQAHPQQALEQAAAEQFFGGGGGEPKVNNKTGMNTFSWNLREADASRFEGMIFWAGGTTGPLVPPGSYSVRTHRRRFARR